MPRIEWFGILQAVIVQHLRLRLPRHALLSLLGASSIIPCRAIVVTPTSDT
jgi:hypothetical protein